MYIEPFVAGVLFTLMAEMAALIIVAVVMNIRGEE